MNEQFFLLKIVIHTGYRCIINVSSTCTNRKYHQWEIRDWHNSRSFSVQGRMVDRLMNISLSSRSINRFYDLMVPSVENAATHTHVKWRRDGKIFKSLQFQGTHSSEKSKRNQ